MKKSLSLLAAAALGLVAYAAPDQPAYLPSYAAGSLAVSSRHTTNADGTHVLAPQGYTAPFNLLPRREKVDGVIIPPYIETFDTEETLKGWTIINVNNDNRDWRWKDGKAAIPTWHLYDGASANKDWLVSLPIRVEAGKSYKIGATLWANWDDERLTVYAGLKPEVAAMKQTVIPLTEFAIGPAGNGLYIEGIMKAESDTVMYLGFFCDSPASSWVFMDNLTISAGYSAEGPAAPEITSIKGVMETTKATITVKAPTVNGQDVPLTGKIDLQVMRDYNIIASFPQVDPGHEVTVDDEVASPAVCSYQAYAKGGEVSAPKKAFLGLEKPNVASNVKVTELPEGKATITWTPNLNGASGYPINTDKFTFSIYNKDKELIEANLAKPSYTAQITEFGEQAMAMFYVTVTNSEGESALWPTPAVPIGPALDFPIEESFAEQIIEMPMGFELPLEQSSWYTASDTKFQNFTSYDQDNGFLNCLFINYIDTIYTSAYLPKVNVPKQGEAKFSFYIYNLKNDEVESSNFLTVSAVCEGEIIKLGSGYIDEYCYAKKGWKQLEYDLSQFYGKEIYLILTLTEPHFMNTPFDLIQFSGVSSVESIAASNDVVETAHYSIDGRRVSPSVSGLHIVTYSDGTAKKVMNN